MKILVCGNPLVAKDATALKAAELLKKMLPEVEFEEFDSVEELHDEEINILDAVKGLKKPVVVRNIDEITVGKAYSMHDFDLGQTLKLLKKLGMIKKVKIFGVPCKLNKKTIEELAGLIKSNLPSRNAWRSSCTDHTP